MYDFIISEAEAIKNDLPSESMRSHVPARAQPLPWNAGRFVCGSIAKYGAGTPSVALPGGEVGIDAAKATGYYNTALTAAKEIISGRPGLMPSITTAATSR